LGGLDQHCFVRLRTAVGRLPGGETALKFALFRGGKLLDRFE
jgi:hypothetical protein